MENEEGKTYKVRLLFDIDVPNNAFRSNINTAALLLHEIYNIGEYCSSFDIKVRNHLIDQLKMTLDGMKIIDIEGD